MCRKALLTAISVVVLLAPIASRADDGNSTSEDLKQVRVQLQKEERRMTDLKKKAEAYQRAEDQLTTQLDEATKKSAAMTEQLEGLRQQADTLAETVRSTRDSLASRKATLEKRVVAVYKSSHGSPALAYLFGAASPNDLVRRGRYLDAISQYDRDYAATLEKMLTTMEADRQKLDGLTKEKTDAVDQLAKLEQDLNDKKEKKANLLKQEQDEMTKREPVVAKLRASATRLEQVVSNIMGGERVPAPTPEPETAEHQPPPDRPEVITAPSNEQPAPQNAGIIMTPFSGKGLEPQRGRLIFPVNGGFVQHFGKQRHEEFSDVLFVKGVEVKAPVGAQVRAVADGKVVLSQVLPGYGNVIIIDHGQRYYTLYGRLASSLKSLGSTVKAGEPLAVLGELDYKGRNFYFELRVKGKAVNPADYCKSLPEATPG